MGDLTAHSVRSDKLIAECSRALADAGPFAALVPEFRSRPQQDAMTRRVAEAIAGRSNLVVEAGTGVGKTFAYLVPAVLFGGKVVISTATRYLQDQIYEKDLPLVLEALNVAADTALLKGRSNYLCLERLEQAWRSRSLDAERSDVIERVYRWSKTAPGGDISDFDGLGEDDPLWASMTSTSENCLGAGCPKYEQCCVVKARNRALEANLVVVNHYLLLADMTLKEEGFGQLLPEVGTVIVDEAHQLGDIADQFFSTAFTSHQVMQLLHDLRGEGDEAKTPALTDASAEVTAAVKAMVQALSRLPSREATSVALKDDNAAAAQRSLAWAIGRLADALRPLEGRSEQLDNLVKRCQDLQTQFMLVLAPGDDADGGADEDTAEDEEPGTASQACARIGWYQAEANSFRFYSSPADVTPLLGEKQKLYDANWIYTSATLSLGGDFSYFLSRSGLDEGCACVALDSPFDYAEQAALYVPKNLPEPGRPGHTESVVEVAYPLLEMVQGSRGGDAGGAFFLFTSHRALKVAAEKIGGETDYTLLVQGTAPKARLIRRFRAAPGAVLLGTASFWEGVDVRGAGLRCVIIDKLPFASPADPLTRGRSALAARAGRSYFREASLPEAVIALRQGIGRLIRDEADAGVVMIGDTRLRTRNYGRVFLDSLPPMKRCSRVESLRPYLCPRSVDRRSREDGNPVNNRGEATHGKA